MGSRKTVRRLGWVCALAMATSPLAGLVARAGGEPLMTGAQMLDDDDDGKTDGVLITYNELIKHGLDREKPFPFKVTGRKVKKVLKAAGSPTLRIVLAEAATTDLAVAPDIQYKRTRSKPVKDLDGVQAINQIFTNTAPLNGDTDGDTFVGDDCDNNDPDVYPGAPDVPDPDGVDANCDGIDGVAADAIFVSTSGADANPGTKDSPKQTIGAAVAAANSANKDVYAAVGTYIENVNAADDVGIYGDYDPATWARPATGVTTISGNPAVLADDDLNVTLQLLSLDGGVQPATRHSIALRAINGSSIDLVDVSITVSDALAGSNGANLGGVAPGGGNGHDGNPGVEDSTGLCDASPAPQGGLGGTSVAGRTGGKGGAPGKGTNGGTVGGTGTGDTPGGPGAPCGGDRSCDGTRGSDGASGTDGSDGTNGQPSYASSGYAPTNGASGQNGVHGNGGGGGGGGGGGDDDCDSYGSSGGGGGAGGTG
ncbi:MAG: putative metal-binding motif-containing protein, partial [Actinomycetota bacterium]